LICAELPPANEHTLVWRLILPPVATVASLLLSVAAAQAFDESENPDLSGRWARIRRRI